MRAYLDSCVVIYLVEHAEPWAGRIQDAIDAEEGIGLEASHLVRLECVVKPLRMGDTELVAEFGLFFDPKAPLALDSAALFDLAARLRAEHNLKTPDAIHLACAIEHGCEELWTNDGRFADAARERITVRVFS